MEDSTLFMQWAMNTTLQQEQPASTVGDRASPQVFRDPSHVQDLTMGGPAANTWIPGGSTDGSVNHIAAAAAAAPADCDVLRLPPLLPNLGRNALSSRIGDNAAASWNFSASTAPGPSELSYRSQPTRTASLRCARTASLAPYAREHIMAERKRREKINQRFVELSAVIPSLTKMDKATILSSATSYVKELKESLKAREAVDSDLRSINNTVILINKKPCHGTPVARNTLPDVEVLFSGKSIMVKIHCENGKGVIVKVLTEAEKLHLGIIDANVMAFSASTLIITITARASPPYLLYLL
ncbi:hypothetical protein PR202_gn00359 [Eleusine coracana subsp. coracana]|uniref:BHLH domain-containing protein n=1 Tax=Eleusine coracana subsp. coracana TaxID=191504 RepID=A0AAV5G1A5_ELECO|nr:hypothetical protein PR202_gn00359 [Eleusine coracana subsp. coracana]